MESQQTVLIKNELFVYKIPPRWVDNKSKVRFRFKSKLQIYTLNSSSRNFSWTNNVNIILFRFLYNSSSTNRGYRGKDAFISCEMEFNWNVWFLAADWNLNGSWNSAGFVLTK